MSALAQLVIFSDLDGCLLDRSSYQWEPARPALEVLKRRGIPLVFCSSKTQAELQFHREQLGLADPFIAENGGAVLIPQGYFPDVPPGAFPRGPYEVLEFGVPYSQLTDAYREIRQVTGLGLRGFAEMTAAEVARLTGLDLDGARRAKARQHDEPFVGEMSPPDVERLEKEARRRGLTLVRGGRFYHLTGDNSKGLAVDVLTGLYRSCYRGLTTVGLGDAANDLAMLERVDIPVVIPRELSLVDPVFQGRPWAVAPAPGPVGWAGAIRTILTGARP